MTAKRTKQESSVILVQAVVALVLIIALGSHVAQLLADEGVFDHGQRFRSMVLPDIFIDQASPEDMYAVAGMSARDIEAKVLSVLGIAQIGEARA